MQNALFAAGERRDRAAARAIAAHVSVGYQYVRGRQPDHVDQPERADAASPAGTNNGCRPNPDLRATTASTRRRADSNYHGLHVSFVQRPTRWGYYRVSYTLSKSMNNVGEFFFSSPIDPFDLSKDWGRSDDDQRHRLVFNGGVNTPMAPAQTLWETLSHGFQVSSMLQAYSALPFNITSGRHDDPGHGRPARSSTASSSSATPASADDFFSLSLRLSRSFRVGTGARVEGAGRGVQPDEPAQRSDAERATSAPAPYPDQSIADLQSDHGGRRSADVPVRRPRQILNDRVPKLGAGWLNVVEFSREGDAT